MMIIKLSDVYDAATVYINMEFIRCFYSTLEQEHPGTTIVYNDGTYTKVKETPDEILELLKAEDPLREKILDQMDEIDNMLDKMDKQDPWNELMRRFTNENKD